MTTPTPPTTASIAQLADSIDTMYLRGAKLLDHLAQAVHTGVEQAVLVVSNTQSDDLVRAIADVHRACDRMLLGLGPGAEIAAISGEMPVSSTENKGAAVVDSAGQVDMTRDQQQQQAQWIQDALFGSSGSEIGAAGALSTSSAAMDMDTA
ncbi:hypothetical protein BC828DRAFT_408314 [Blastocladiella britannica]|nr:hypothetical protein BC828DRAFT_408314 [Blastocladiella britannica]